MSMQTMARNLLFLLLVAWTVAGAAATPQATRVLFVGNSLTYVGNLPAVFASLAEANGKPVETAMIVKGGATLKQWQDAGVVPRALAARHYDYVVLQERGGDFTCSFGPESCVDARQALAALARAIRVAGARPLLLGTPQSSPQAAARIMQAESAAARANGMPYVPVAGHFVRGWQAFPDDDWLVDMHPGHEPTLVKALALYRQVFGCLPSPRPLTVHAPMFVAASKFAAPAPVSRPLTVQGLATSYRYDQTAVDHAFAVLRDASPGP